MRCNYFINNTNQCKLKTHSESGYCHRHRQKAVSYKYPKPKTCPVCYCSLHQSKRPLHCGHWVHRICVEKSGKAQCPICRDALPDITPQQDHGSGSFDIDDIINDYEIERVEIPEDVIVSAVISYQLYAFILSPRQRRLGLSDFISGAVNDIVPVEHPFHDDISSILYCEALRIFFDPDNWNAALPTVSTVG